MLNTVLITAGFLAFFGVLYVVAAKAGLLNESAGAAASDADDAPLSEGRYRRREPGVLTDHERAFAPTLDKAARQLLDDLGPLRVLSKVRFGDRIEPDASGNRSQQRLLRNSINQKHADFVLVDDTWRAVCVVELDDASHRRAKAKQADATKDAALASAGVPVVRVTGRDGVDGVIDKVISSRRNDVSTMSEGRT